MKYWFRPTGLAFLLLLVFLVIPAVALYFVGGWELLETANVALSAVGLILNIYFTYVLAVAIIKRLHDLDKSGWLGLLFFVPLANLYVGFICAFFKGTDGENQDPLTR